MARIEPLSRPHGVGGSWATRETAEAEARRRSGPLRNVGMRSRTIAQERQERLRGRMLRRIRHSSGKRAEFDPITRPIGSDSESMPPSSVPKTAAEPPIPALGGSMPTRGKPRTVIRSIWSGFDSGLIVIKLLPIRHTGYAKRLQFPREAARGGLSRTLRRNS